MASPDNTGIRRGDIHLCPVSVTCFGKQHEVSAVAQFSQTVIDRSKLGVLANCASEQAAESTSWPAPRMTSTCSGPRTGAILQTPK